MAATATDRAEFQIPIMAHVRPSETDTIYNPLAGLPEGYATTTFSGFTRLAKAVKSIHGRLEENNGEGNQYLVVLGLSDYALSRLENEPRILGVAFRLQYDENLGIIKVLPNWSHEVPHLQFLLKMERRFAMMGIPEDSHQFAGATVHKGSVTTRGKEPDQCFHPPSRKYRPGQTPQPWPTLVLEVGNTESLSKLQEDARWWFSNSEGDVRIVLLLKVRKTTETIDLQKWQLAPPNTPPLTRSIIAGFSQANPPTMPPLFRQPAASQKAYCIQEITISSVAATGQLVLPFHAVYDRPPMPPETDIIFTQAELIPLAESVYV